MELQTVEYKKWLRSIKQKIKTAQFKAALSVNAQLMELYWELAKDIVSKQHEAYWGDSILEQLSIDLKIAFPNVGGFSRRNLYAMRQWHLFYSSVSEFVPQAVAQIPWGHNRLIISKIKDATEALFYCNATACNAEYSLRDIQKPFGISEYQLTQALPKIFETQLPTVAQLEIELNTIEDNLE